MEFERFRQLVRENPTAMVPVCRELLADTLTPVAAFLRLRRQGAPAFLLESVEGGERIGRYSFLGVEPFRGIRANGSLVTVGDSRGNVISSGERSFFTVFDEELGAFQSANVPGLPPFTGGAVGYCSYDAIRYIEQIPDRHLPENELPEAQFHFYDTVVAFDHARHRLLLITNVHPMDKSERSDAALNQRFEEVQQRFDGLERMLARRVSGEESPGRIQRLEPRSITADMASNVSRQSFEDAVRSAKEYIASGDAFQIVLSQRFQRPVSADPFEVYRILRALNPSPYLFFLQWGETALFGSSPETLVKVGGRTVSVRPIAGTRRRGKTAEEDVELEKELLADEKELAEHRMLVDLGRNDVGRVARFGTVELPTYLAVERYSHVMHIVSEVQGELRDGLTALDAFKAGFPAGTVSGAPKIRAMEIIDELERTRRGIYAGAVGYVDFAGNLDTCIAIRTILFHEGVAEVQAGAGIVADSVPEREYMETVHKATALFEAIRMAEAQKEDRGQRSEVSKRQRR